MSRKRWEESSFIQQTLSEWRPDMTAGRISPVLIIIGILFVPVGVSVLYISSKIQEMKIDYTYCVSEDSIASNKNVTCADVIGSYRNLSCICNVEFSLSSDFESPVYIYYGLTNFYQNHQKYIKSRDDSQLLGRLSNKVSSDCHPYRYNIDAYGNQKTIAPCGAVANSMFSDELSITFSNNSLQKVQVPLLKTGIAIPSDREIKFRNPPGVLKTAFENYSKPVDWVKNIWELDEKNNSNNGFQNEDFIVWMRTAALPKFKKLYRLLNNSHPFFSNGLPKGNYTLHVVYTYPVKGFDGTKSVFIRTGNTLETGNRFTGIAYTIVGVIMIMFGIALKLIDKKYVKKRIAN